MDEFISTPSLLIPVASFTTRPSSETVLRDASDGSLSATRAASCSDQQFLQLLGLYRALGGLTRLQQVQDSVDQIGDAREPMHREDDRVERWLAERRIFAVRWSDRSWVPQFQVERSSRRPFAHIADILGVLDDTFDDAEIAAWFATANVWIGGRAPAAALESDTVAVLDAARADRFIARG
jgi:hypothetical protein